MDLGRTVLEEGEEAEEDEEEAAEEWSSFVVAAGQAQALPVVDLLEAPDLSVPAATPEEFLARARWEARLLSDVLVDPTYRPHQQQRQQNQRQQQQQQEQQQKEEEEEQQQPPRRSLQQQSPTTGGRTSRLFFQHLAIPHNTYPDRLPSPHWEKRFCASYGRLRNSLERWECRLSQQPLCGRTPTPACPVSRNRKAWRAFLATQDPQLSTVLLLDQVAVRALLAVTCRGLEDILTKCRHPAAEEAIPAAAGELLSRCSAWLFALGSRLEVPFDGDTSSVLRSILRTACHLRNLWQLEQGEAVLGAGDVEGAQEILVHQQRPLACLNVCITICGTYFKQLSPEHVWETPPT